MRSRFFNSTTLVFFGVIILVAVWIGSGMIERDDVTEETTPAPRAPSVAASWSEAEDITRELVLYGDVEPVQVSTLRARTDGLVEEVVSQGYRAERGEIVARLSTDDREAQLARAQAQVTSAQSDYQAAQQLAERGVGPASEAQTRLAQLEAARAELRVIELDIANTELRAPIAGVINRVMADTGAYVAVGGEVVEIVDNDPLLAVVHVQQAAVASVREGMEAEVRFIGGQSRQGTIRFVSSLADAATRTFRVEIEIDNPEGELPAGLSAEVVIPFETVAAHRVSPALGRLDEQGRIGLHVVDEDDRLRFVPVEIIRARADGVWVTGLDERARIVTISQGTLAPGQQVEVQETPEAYLEGAGLGTADDEEALDAIESQESGDDDDNGPSSQEAR